MTLWVPAVVVGPLRVEKFQLIGLTPTFAHLLCAHIVPLVLGCRGPRIIAAVTTNTFQKQEQ